MARPREFDEAAVLGAATEAFWSLGFEGASTRELAARTGLTVASLYNAFGDKRALYRRVLDDYAARALEGCGEALAAGAPRPALEAFFAALADEGCTEAGRKGCLVVNAGLESAPHDAEFQAVVNDVFARIEALFRACVARGQADGSICADAPADDLARLLLTTMLGVRVLARSGSGAARMQGAVRSVRALLEP